MNFDEFTGTVQHRLELPGTGEAVRATRATLTTLGERIQAGEATDLAGPLPMEVDFYLTGAVAEHGQRFDWNEFLDRVAEREGQTAPDDRADVAHHARTVVAVAAEAIPAGQLDQVRDQLPADEGWGNLFELVEADGAQAE
ncbi:DUF2267 domain-containing protein [Halosimplex rubrum]|uniref:DUF2267 domain-containing protein n=1 Tax=Halosimplex rubrum TaxID=869889 RepID=A0A7D5P229_9EURY|nr:DUF2267 domain-containing protein [Halosimplex rubrum]QLH77141.1 DUF2267 domain-containing protein [Halosimplex rubrum]